MLSTQSWFQKQPEPPVPIVPMAGFARNATIIGALAIVALTFASFADEPVASAYASGPAPGQTSVMPVSYVQAAARGMDDKPETVEQRITKLHADLKITPAEETAWNDVAQTMRENAAAMEKLSADRMQHAPQGMTAIDDLRTYQAFAQAHLDGLKALIASFDTLYGTMPDEQKKLADRVFQKFGPKGHMAHS